MRRTDARSTPTLLALLLLGVACGGPATPPTADPRLERVDVFGSTQLDRVTLIERHGQRLVVMLDAFERERTRAIEIGNEIEAAIRADGRFAYVDFDVVTYIDPPATFVTLDLVDEADRDLRMRFVPAPTAQIDDPGGLLAAWRTYEEKMWPVLRAARGTGPAACPAWHCLAGFEHADLAPFEPLFDEGVAAHEAALIRVLREDTDDGDRAAAAFLLAHLDDGARVVEHLVPSFRDAATMVRNNAMRVVAQIAMKHPEIPIPLPPVLEALRLPATTDRNKASAILAGVAKAASPEVRAQVAREAGDVLVAMLALGQPNNHDFAYLVLQAVSGEVHGEHDQAAWDAWWRALRSEMAALPVVDDRTPPATDAAGSPPQGP